MADDGLWALIEGQNWGALVTLKRDGRPQLSNVNYALDRAAATLRISVTAGRAKTVNLRRDPRASFYVTKADSGGYVVAEGTAALSPVAAAPDDATAEELIEVYRLINGEHEDWDDYRAAMVRDQRLVCTLHVDRLYGWAGF